MLCSVQWEPIGLNSLSGFAVPDREGVPWLVIALSAAADESRRAAGQEVQAIVRTAAWRAERTAAELLGEHRLADLRRNLTDLVALLDSAA